MFNNPPLRSCGGSVFARPLRCAANISCKKITVIISATVARAIQDRLHTQQGLWIFLSCLRLLPGLRFMPLVGAGGYSNLVLLVHRFSDHCGLGGHWVRTYFSIVSISYQICPAEESERTSAIPGTSAKASFQLSLRSGRPARQPRPPTRQLSIPVSHAEQKNAHHWCRRGTSC